MGGLNLKPVSAFRYVVVIITANNDISTNIKEQQVFLCNAQSSQVSAFQLGIALKMKKNPTPFY